MKCINCGEVSGDYYKSYTFTGGPHWCGNCDTGKKEHLNNTVVISMNENNLLCGDCIEYVYALKKGHDYGEQLTHKSITKQDNIVTCSTCKHYAEETRTETGGVALCSEKAVNVPGASEEMDCHEPRPSTAATFVSNNVMNYIWGLDTWGLDLSHQPEPLRCTLCEIELRNTTPTIFRDELLCQNCAKKPLTKAETAEIKAINTLISALSDSSDVSDGKHTFGEYETKVKQLESDLLRANSRFEGGAVEVLEDIFAALDRCILEMLTWRKNSTLSSIASLCDLSLSKEAITQLKTHVRYKDFCDTSSVLGSILYRGLGIVEHPNTAGGRIFISDIEAKCPQCGGNTSKSFRYTNKFFCSGKCMRTYLKE